MAIEITVKGLDKLKYKLDKLSNDMQRELKDGIKSAGFIVEAQVKPITPIDTGRLRGSIASDILFGGWGVKIAPHTEYAIFVHSGTSRWPLSMPPKNPGTVRQFMKVGAEKSIPIIQQMFNDIIKRILE